MAIEPIDVTIRMFVVGFGDCFLLTFHYAPPLKDQHILIDFGTGGGSPNMKGIAKEIKSACNGKLYAVIATHRHRDHISGFSNKAGAESPGAIIASCKPEIVIQPWTENPKAAANAKSLKVFGKNAAAAYFQSLDAMQAFAQSVVDRAPLWGGTGGRATQVERLAANNTTNPDAVKNLATMGRKAPKFLAYGSASGLESATLLPGVKVRVLGPPTLEQQNLKKYAKDSDEYWIANKYWGVQKSASEKNQAKLFPGAPLFAGAIPVEMRWFVEHANDAYKKNVLGIVRSLDKFLNNTSLILLFEVKGKKLLFPGDAQLENWQWALGQPGIQKLLKDVDVYKVGHHGSRNATPHTLWSFFDKKKGKKLRTLMSTAPGVYDRSADGKVPSTRLVEALKRESNLSSTEKVKRTNTPIKIQVV